MKNTPQQLFKGIFVLCVFSLYTVGWCTIIFILTVFKILLPVKALRAFVDWALHAAASGWVSSNGLVLNVLHKIQWNAQIPQGLSNQKSYLILSNHISAVDIIALQYLFNGKIPFLKFFIKRQLIYVPFLGFAWWALDFPFMKRYSQQFLKKHPEKRGDDLKTTKAMCEKFKGKPTCIVNFAEGTRFTANKLKSQQTSYQNLLIPKAGGIAFAVEVMGNQFTEILDVTLHYPQGFVSLWDLFSGRLHTIDAAIQQRPLPKISGSYSEDARARDQFQIWISEIWKEKDQLISKMKSRL
ncbi:MAG: acyltransferase [Pseudobdellovibrionaceae bacterium]